MLPRRGKGTKMDKITNNTDMMRHNRVCIDLEKATQFITQALQHEVVRNHELCELIRRLEEREVETGRRLAAEAKSKQQLSLEINMLQKHMQQKDHSLSQAKQTVAFLMNELRDLHQQLQTHQINHWTVQELKQWLQGIENQLMHVCPSSSVLSDQQTTLDWSLQLDSPRQRLLVLDNTQSPLVSTGPQVLPDAQSPLSEAESFKSRLPLPGSQSPSPLVSYGGQMLVEDSVSRIKEENTVDDNSYGELSHSVEGTKPRSDQTVSSAPEAEAELVQVQGKGANSNTAPALGSKSDLCLLGPVSQTRLRRVSVVLVDVSRVQGRREKNVEDIRNGKGSCPASTSHTQTQEMEKPKPLSMSMPSKVLSLKSQPQLHPHAHRHERSLSCSQSAKTFLDAENLKSHLCTHTVEMPYRCTHCGKGFITKLSLQTHLRVHKVVKLVQCVLCGKSFRYKSDLKRHQRSHTGERPFRCTQCGKRFTRKNSLKLHERLHTQCKGSSDATLQPNQPVHTGDERTSRGHVEVICCYSD